VGGLFWKRVKEAVSEVEHAKAASFLFSPSALELGTAAAEAVLFVVLEEVKVLASRDLTGDLVGGNREGLILLSQEAGDLTLVDHELLRDVVGVRILSRGRKYPQFLV
jgi:hypothetical protein